MRGLRLGKALALRALGALSRRHPVLLPREAGHPDAILDLTSAYRIDGDEIEVKILEARPGVLEARLYGQDGSFPTRLLWHGPERPYAGPDSLMLTLSERVVRLGKDRWAGAVAKDAGRRLTWRLSYRSGGVTKARTTSHYIAAPPSRPADERYFGGDDYSDYEDQGATEALVVSELAKRFHLRSPLLEIGGATGIVLSRLLREGFDAIGLDNSPWAVEQAARRLGPGRVFLGDPEEGHIPDEIGKRAPYATLLLWNVLEHFAEPFAVLERLSRLMAPGAQLLLSTTNVDSLAHFIFGRDWEGYFDWTHRGVRGVGVRSLAETLPKLGWKITHCQTERFWQGGEDPTQATLRDLWEGDARFRKLLEERKLGDLIRLVAVRA